ncbi:metallophosphoesterase family protein [Kineococcus rhizosphaerae]|uniref:3',5'-cyclic AMP phosphodiesterase CpdA n=1 Tax=Kineococcus rhizosphaerae TaxID=559628 RepID=A0A2T0QZM4_9ACTN|nr:metallophosphoesterase [Kineococcus rhizosphaerae]PRY12146.1 3',5'-cyclic AMP phosphodiesterase CpdA [Kineococcus rhizosphaerae]
MTRILHLSDTHLMAAGALHGGLVDTTAALGHVLESLHGIGSLDAVVVSGDVSDDGTVASYETARDLVGEFARSHRAVAVFAMGNHDLPGEFGQVLGPTRSVHDVDGFRIVVLDSSVPGKGYGSLGAEQLDWLRSVLATPAEKGSAVVVHHSPVPAPTVLHEGLALQDPADLLATLEGSDVRAVLSGHYHHPFAQTLASGLTLLVAPGVANRSDPLVVRGRERIVRGHGALVVEIGETVRSTVLTIPSPGDGQELFELDEATVQRILEESGVPR